MGQFRVLVACGVALLCGNASLVHAQEPPADDQLPAILQDQPIIYPQAPEPPPPRLRRRAIADPYASRGMGDAVFQFFPSLELQGVASNNVAASAANRKSDIGVALRPSLGFQSNWSRHSWSGSASGEWLKYANSPDSNALTGSANTAFRLDILRGTTADFSASFTASQTGGGNADVPNNAISPRRNRSFNAGAGLAQDFGRWEGRLNATAARNSFDDVALSGGGTEINADRNYWEPSIALRGTLGHAGQPLRPYVEVGYNPRFHDQNVDRSGLRRNSQGGSVALGLVLDEGPVWTGEISANFIARDYDDPALENVAALGLSGTITWSPTPLWRIVATSGVSLNESEQLGVSATQNWNAGLTASVALRDNLRINAGAALTFANSNGVVDTTASASLGAEWQLNPNLALNGTVESTWFFSGTPSSNYDEQRVTAGVIVRE